MTQEKIKSKIGIILNNKEYEMLKSGEKFSIIYNIDNKREIEFSVRYERDEYFRGIE